MPCSYVARGVIFCKVATLCPGNMQDIYAAGMQPNALLGKGLTDSKAIAIAQEVMSADYQMKR